MKRTVISLVMLLCANVAMTMAAAPGMQPPKFENIEFEKPNRNDEIKFKSRQKFDRTIYVDAQSGSDKNMGDSPASAIKTLEKLSSMNITAGTEILLKGGQRHVGLVEFINLDLKGGDKPSHLGSYGGSKALIDAKGYIAGVVIRNSSNVTVSDIKISADGGPEEYPYMYREQDKSNNERFGLLVESTSESKVVLTNTLIYNIDVDDVYFQNPSDVWRTNIAWKSASTGRPEGFGTGIKGRVRGGAGIQNITIRESLIEDVGKYGIQFSGAGEAFGPIERNVDQLHIINTTTYQTGGPGMQFGHCTNSTMRYCRMTEPGNRNNNRKWGRGSGMWTHSCTNFILEYNLFEGSQGIGDSCGAHIDQHCKDVIIQYSLSRYNCGGFIEILGNCINCCYRFNVSINDGWRNSADSPTQDFWNISAPGIISRVDGFNKEKRYVDTFNSYLYNNTIVVTKDGAAPYKNKFLFDLPNCAKGILVANNIWWIDNEFSNSPSLHAWKDGKPYEASHDFMVSYEQATPAEVIEPKSGAMKSNIRPMTKAEVDAMNIEMGNNIYKLGAAALPEKYWDMNLMSDNPQFANEMGNEVVDMIPSNGAAISKGAEINILRDDKSGYGLLGGMNLDRDIFGNKIKGNIVGAIVPNAKNKSWDGGSDI